MTIRDNIIAETGFEIGQRVYAIRDPRAAISNPLQPDLFQTPDANPFQWGTVTGFLVFQNGVHIYVREDGAKDSWPYPIAHKVWRHPVPGQKVPQEDQPETRPKADPFRQRASQIASIREREAGIVRGNQ